MIGMNTTIPPELLKPIPGPDPAGVSLRHETIYQRIAEARREEDPNLSQGEWQRAIKKADWHAVDNLCRDVLAHQSKDIQIAAWLTEAWLHLEGLDGLTRGITLLECLCQDYWTNIHPRVEDGDIEYRVGPFQWLNENLGLAISLNLNITESTSDLAEGGLTLAKWEDVLRTENLIRKDVNLEKILGASGKPDRSIFMTAVSLTPPVFFKSLFNQLETSKKAVEKLEAVLVQKLLQDSPGLTRIRSVLETIARLAREFGGAGTPGPTENIEGALPVKTRASPHASSTDVGANPMDQRQTMESDAINDDVSTVLPSIRSREEAYRKLTEVADYLLRTEPHSPTPYLVMRAVNWGKMPLSELLQELAAGEGDLARIYTLLGMH